MSASSRNSISALPPSGLAALLGRGAVPEVGLGQLGVLEAFPGGQFGVLVDDELRHVPADLGLRAEQRGVEGQVALAACLGPIGLVQHLEPQAPVADRGVQPERFLGAPDAVALHGAVGHRQDQGGTGHREAEVGDELVFPRAADLLGMERRGFGFLRKRENLAISRAALAQLNRADIDLAAPVRSISIGEQRMAGADGSADRADIGPAETGT